MTITTKPQGHVQVDNMEDEFPYQAGEMPNNRCKRSLHWF